MLESDFEAKPQGSWTHAIDRPDVQDVFCLKRLHSDHFIREIERKTKTGQ